MDEIASPDLQLEATHILASLPNPVFLLDFFSRLSRKTKLHFVFSFKILNIYSSKSGCILKRLCGHKIIFS